MMRFFAFFVLCASFVGSAAAEAERPVLIELFANQNCPACPKAHRTMKQVEADRDDVFILTWTVNYWDYLGEPDPMALDIAKDRQMAYTDRLSLRAPYTPQSFYDGAKECPGTRKRDIRRNINRRLKTRAETAPSFNWDGAQMEISGTSEASLDVVLVEYLSGEANPTKMVNPVVQAKSLGAWSGETTAYPVTCEMTCAILLQEENTGEVIAVQALN